MRHRRSRRESCDERSTYASFYLFRLDALSVEDPGSSTLTRLGRVWDCGLRYHWVPTHFYLDLWGVDCRTSSFHLLVPHRYVKNHRHLLHGGTFTRYHTGRRRTRGG